MDLDNFKIRQYDNRDKYSVIELWHKCKLTRSWNNPEKDIDRKLKFNPELFLVGTIEDQIIATIMGGYEGHRGWVNYLAVEPSFQRKGLGKKMMSEMESRLLAIDCPKINLQVRDGNNDAMAFYEKIGYANDNVIGMGKRLIQDS